MPEEVAVESNTPAQQPAESSSQKAVETLVLDTNLFIKGLPVSHISNRFVTVPDVVHELRSRASKDRYKEFELKYGMELIEPDGESIRAVGNFAKKTGDFASLAVADIKVIALAFMLEKQANGMKNLRLEPVKNPDISNRELLRNARVAGTEQKEQLEDIEEQAERAERAERAEQGVEERAGQDAEERAEQANNEARLETAADEMAA
ncbi:20S-pre-rRNA D-site endonuclease nob1, partial [Coemansia sp. RSA 1086]